MRTQTQPTVSAPFIQIFTDGGLLSGNPSDKGLTWAWCRVEGDTLVSEDCGWIRAADLPGGRATSNQAEFYAMLRAFQALADNEIIHICADSEVTIGRWTGEGRYGLGGILPEWATGMRYELRRCGGVFYAQYAGHPSKADLERGYKVKNGKPSFPVSKWNQHVDGLCTRQAALANLLLDCEALEDEVALEAIVRYAETITHEQAITAEGI